MKAVNFLKRNLILTHMSFFVLMVVLVGFLLTVEENKASNLKKITSGLLSDKGNLQSELKITQEKLGEIKNEDQFVKNKKLEEEIKNIHNTYLKTVVSYEKVLSLKDSGTKTDKLDDLIAQALKYLADKNYASAEASLKKLEALVVAEQEKKITVPQNIVQANTPPGVGYRRQLVKIDGGEFVVDIVTADLNSTKIIVDTASESACVNDCPVLPLSDYVNRNGAFAGVNGSYFCPSTYPQCVDKKNSFDTLLMNKNKVYFNSDNNVYSTVPAVIFAGNSIRFVQKSLEWGRDTSVDGVIANQPLLVFNNAVVFGGDGDAKHQSKGGRSFVGATGSNVYIGVVRSATVAEEAKVLYALGIHNALNLDDGGSTALWSGGYKVGPGRNIPNAVLFVKK